MHASPELCVPAAGGAAAEEGQATGPAEAASVASPPSRCPSAALICREDSVEESKPRKAQAEE